MLTKTQLRCHGCIAGSIALLVVTAIALPALRRARVHAAVARATRILLDTRSVLGTDELDLAIHELLLVAPELRTYRGDRMRIVSMSAFSTRVISAGQAAFELLRARRDSGSDELDAALHEVGRVLCTKHADVVRDAVATEPIDLVFPTDRLDDCDAILCGACYTTDRTWALAPAFLTLSLPLD